MKASILDLRYHMKAVLSALDRNEVVQIIYHGKVKGEIRPLQNKTYKKAAEHPFFGMLADTNISVQKEMERLRGNRWT